MNKREVVLRFPLYLNYLFNIILIMGQIGSSMCSPSGPYFSHTGGDYPVHHDGYDQRNNIAYHGYPVDP